MKSADRTKLEELAGTILFSAVILFLYPLIIQWLWNILAPDFGIQAITYPQAFVLRMLVITLVRVPKYKEV
jgi:positive regulator of sigma E activity